MTPFSLRMRLSLEEGAEKSNVYKNLNLWISEPDLQLSTWVSSRFSCEQSKPGYVSRKQACKMRYGSQMQDLEGLNLSTADPGET